MRGNELLDKMELIDPAYVEAADRWPVRKKSGWWKWAVLAACLCLAIAVIPIFGKPSKAPEDEPGDAPPCIAIGGSVFVISRYDRGSEEPPDGFVEAGTAKFDGVGEDFTYYVNPDVPEWIYVKSKKVENGAFTDDDVYIRLVDERVRDDDLVCFHGTYYISMSNIHSFSDYPDVSRKDYERVDSRYTEQAIEGIVPEGFVLAGTAKFSGHDTVPAGSLASNKEEARVYYNPDDPAVVFVEDYLFLHTKNRSKRTLYVYIRCGHPLERD